MVGGSDNLNRRCVMGLMWLSEDERRMIASLRDEIVKLCKSANGVGKEVLLSGQVIDLRKRIVELEIQEGKIKEGHAKEDRELRHMIGLEKERQKFEIQQAKRETTVVVREENLSADKKRFEDQMKFQEKRFTEEVGYLKGLMESVLERLPNIDVSVKRGK